MRRLLGALVVLAAVSPEPAAAQQLVGQITRFAELVEDVVIDSFGRSLPMPAASAGVSYSFDPATGNFRRDPSTFGQVYLDRSTPLGDGRLNLSLSYQFVRLDEIDGRDARALHDRVPIPLRGRLAAVEFTTLDAHAEVHQFLVAANYGVTEEFEVGVAAPLVYSATTVGAALRARGVTPQSELVTFRASDEQSDDVVGLGDVFLRAKHRLIERRHGQASAALVARLPVGHGPDLQGAEVWELSPWLLASTRLFEPAPWARLQGHVNAGVNFDLEDVDASGVRWGVGLDWGVSRHVTAAVGVLARHQLERVAPPGFFDFPRCRGTLTACATDPSVRGAPRLPLFGLSGERVDYYDLSLGGRGALWRDTVFAFANVLVPLNDGFVRADPVPLVGVEATF